MNDKQPPTDIHGFQAVDPWTSEKLVLRRRNLPHLQAAEATYFVTFRSSLSQELPLPARDVVIEEFLASDKRSIDLDAVVVMPDHVHAILRLLGCEKLSRVLQMIKGRSSRRINQLFKREGHVWMDETFDHIIRHEAELEEKIAYIQQNPVKSGLVTSSEDYRWLLMKKHLG